MSLPRYPKYKCSGISWAAELPVHWGTASLKWLCQRYSGGTPDKNRPEYWEGGTIPWLNSGAVNDGRICEPSALITQAAFENSSAKWIPAGALVMALAGQGKTKGMVAQLMIESTCNQSMAAIVPNERVNVRFIYWWLAGNYQNIRNMAGGDLRDGLNLDLLGEIPCPLPPLIEQSTVAIFLDGETAKIDALIAEQEKLLTLLAEKRQATISHAVTRGLNPDAPMKDSGVAWLGKIPAHWRMCPLKLLSRIGNGSTPNRDNPSYWTSDGFPWLNSSVVNQDEVTEAKQFVSQLALEECHLPIVQPPAVLVGITGQGKTRGMATRLAFTATLNQHLAYIKPNEKQLFETYLLRVLEAAYSHLRTESDGAGSTKGAITCDQLGRLRIPVPDLGEQHTIAMFLDDESCKLDALKAEAERAIGLLKERRSALISAAVTGKIDVRNAVPEELAA